MSHAIYKVESIKIVAPYTLNVRFDDGTSRRIDFTPIRQGELYGSLRDQQLFEQVTLDPEVHTLVWPNGADFDPETLHDWPLHAEQVNTSIKHWPRPHETLAEQNSSPNSDLRREQTSR